MDIFNFCWMTLLDESKKCCVFFDKNTCNVRNDIDENFNKPINRISYLYKFGSYNISFFHQCFKEFFTKAPDSTKIIDNFRSVQNLTICSMSAGPGTDVIGLLYSLYVVSKPLLNPTTFKVISRHGSWRNLVTEMISSSIISVPDLSTCKLIECDFLKTLSKKAQGYLRAADVLLMCNSFSSSVMPEKVMYNILKRVVRLLKHGAIVFFISSKETSDYFSELDSFGSFLYGPVEVTLENMPYNEKIIEVVGVKPLCSGRSLFAVWQKFHEIKCGINLQDEKENNSTISNNQHLPTKLICTKRDVQLINSPILNMTNLKKEFSNDKNTSSIDSIASSSQFSVGSVSNQINKKIIMKDKPVSKNSIDFVGQNIDSSETKFNNSAKNTSATSLNSSDSVSYVLPCVSNHKDEKNNGDNIHSLMKKFETLITKLEELIISQDSLKTSYVKEKQSASSQHHYQNTHEPHCRCSIKLSHNIKDDMTCYHSSMCHKDISVNNCNRSMNIISNSYRTSPHEGPYIVIPLQNLSNESLAQILSIICQNTSSTNDTTLNLLPKKEKS